jgi:hypothetical protein
MKNLIVAMRVWLRFEDRNEKTFWLGLLMLFVGLAFSYSVFTALTVVGAGLALESVITSYLVGVLNSKAKE